MSSSRSKLRLTGAFAVLATLALAISCRGFFVKPTLSSIAIGPATPTIETGNTDNTVQMSATGTYNDGSVGHPSVAWTIAPATSGGTTAATITQSGLVTAVALGTMTVTATSNDISTISGSTTVTVTVGCITSIAITPTGPNAVSAGDTFQFTATAQTCNGPQDITSVATWASSNTNAATIDGNGLATGVTSNTSTQITASSGTIVSQAVTLNVD